MNEEAMQSANSHLTALRETERRWFSHSLWKTNEPKWWQYELVKRPAMTDGDTNTRRRV